MTTYTTRLVRMKWQGPIKPSEIRDSERTENEQYGVYQIVGDHAVHGPRSLLYIGQAIEQTFEQRLAQHKHWLEHEQGVEIYLGHPVEDDYEQAPPDWKDWHAIVDAVEKLTVWYLSPPYNSSNIVRYTGQQHLLIQNHG